MPAERRPARKSTRTRREPLQPPRAEMSNAAEMQRFKQQLAITPKTAAFLVELGYKDYRELRTLTPNLLVAQLAKLPSLDARRAEDYRRACRRMVWLATQDEPAERAKTCQDWTQKGLTANGVWRADFDSLNGNQIDSRMKAA